MVCLVFVVLSWKPSSGPMYSLSEPVFTWKLMEYVYNRIDFNIIANQGWFEMNYFILLDSVELLWNSGLRIANATTTQQTIDFAIFHLGT